jgi:hypothetical protein
LLVAEARRTGNTYPRKVKRIDWEKKWEVGIQRQVGEDHLQREVKTYEA